MARLPVTMPDNLHGIRSAIEAPLPHNENAGLIYVRVIRPEDRFPAIEDELATAINVEEQPENRIKVVERL